MLSISSSLVASSPESRLKDGTEAVTVLSAGLARGVDSPSSSSSVSSEGVDSVMPPRSVFIAWEVDSSFWPPSLRFSVLSFARRVGAPNPKKDFMGFHVLSGFERKRLSMKTLSISRPASISWLMLGECRRELA